MPGMNSGLNIGNPLLVAAFKSALLHQGIVALLVLAVLGLALVCVRETRMPIPAKSARAGHADASAVGSAEAGADVVTAGPGAGDPAGPPVRYRGAALRIARRKLAGSGPPEPSWRMVLRVGFGLLWIFDGILQAQPGMVVGLPSQIIKPTAADSPLWVQHLANWAGTSWTYHPVQAAAAAVWIQIGIGCWMVFARRGRWSQLGALAGVAWGLVVWIFAEAFGEIFAPGLTFLFGAPGAALLYSVAGALIALPERTWRSPRLARLMVAGTGLFFAGMTVLQAWPGRGYWQGRLHGGPGSLTAMVQEMAGTPQPGLLASWARGFGQLTASHGFAVNLVAVVAMAAIGAGLLSLRPALVRGAVIVAMVLCLLDWVLIEDIGFFGGLGTDPNTMIPVALIVLAGYLAFTAARSTVPAAALATEPAPAGVRPARRPVLRRVGTAVVSVDARTVAAAWALGITLLGTFPLAAAAADRSADPLIAKALDGPATALNYPAAPFSLTGQDGRPVSLASLRGKTVLLTFLDPVCTTDCPIIAQEFREADQLLGSHRKNVALIAIAANPAYHTIAYTQAFNRQEHLTGLPNWNFLSGPLPVLKKIWHDYYYSATLVPAGGMVLHSDVAYVIDASGHTRFELNVDPGPGSQASKSSFAAELAADATAAMK